MGNLWNGHLNQIQLPSYSTFIPRFTVKRENQRIPEVFQLHEFILQSLVRQYFSDSKNLEKLLSSLGVKGVTPRELEILGEKAFPEGLVDILIKEAVPKGMARKIIVEVKANAAKEQDLAQLKTYSDEIAEECIASILIAKKFSSPIVRRANEKHIKLIKYVFSGIDEISRFYTFEDLLKGLHLEVVTY